MSDKIKIDKNVPIPIEVSPVPSKEGEDAEKKLIELLNSFDSYFLIASRSDQHEIDQIKGEILKLAKLYHTAQSQKNEPKNDEAVKEQRPRVDPIQFHLWVNENGWQSSNGIMWLQIKKGKVLSEPIPTFKLITLYLTSTKH